MYDAVLLDMDGVVLQGYKTPRDRYRQAARAVLEELGLDPEPTLVALLVDPDTAELPRFRATFERRGLDPDRVWARREALASEFSNRAIAAGERTLYPDIDALETLDVDLGLVSNNRHETVRFVADMSEVPFAVVRGRDPTLEGYRRLKPDPYYLNDALARLDADLPIYVGDRYTDVEAARRAGVRSVLLDRGDGQSLGDGEHTPDTRIRSLRALQSLEDAAGR